jgi:hypothetical protein
MMQNWEGVLFNSVFLSALIAVWIVLLVKAVRSLMRGGERPEVHLRTVRDILDEHLTRRDIDRERYVDRRKALDEIIAIV